MDQVGNVGGMRRHSTAGQVESKFIDDHVAGADKQGGVAARRDWNCNGDRQAGRKRLLWSVEDGARAALSPGLSTGRSLIGTSGGQCGQLKRQNKAGDDRMKKLLLTVWEAADVLSDSRSRVYELIDAEQLDSVKIGRARPVSPALVRRLAGGPSAS
jgi:excisionase family DNA binding protein